MNARKPMPRALVVDDEPDIRDLLSLTLRRMQVEVETAGDQAGAQRRLGAESFDLVLTDMRLPDGNGLDIVQWIQHHRPGMPVAVITAHGNVETAVRALKLGAFDFISKPLDLVALRKLIAATLKLRDDDAAPHDETQPVVPVAAFRLLGQSRPMQQLRQMIAKVARSQAPVHISGDSGTGKELVARLIHESGPRRDGPFVPVNCGAIPSELMESELFGHKKGSFTGAAADKEGLIRSAEGGTLFLDEVADLPLHMQVKLLRVIQEKSVRPVGETREVPVDVRILSATHRKLDDLVRAGRFREDLYYRIDVIDLRVPPLRERLDDVPALVDVMLDRVSRQIGVRRPQISDEAMDKLLSYSYPGNVRELENILERAVTLCSHHRIEPEDIQLKQGQLLTDLPELAGRASGLAPEDLGADGLEGQLEHIQREAIVRALEQTRYNKTKAAELLGMTFRQLRYRVKKLGID
ncbi:MAG TPA: sigma-54 dependent transcriptional regulator [Steroidobacteraceae bacterium]|nr:sigma-54 dependent transcriptional regulator [Steroidobacteraceae bacterium]